MFAERSQAVFPLHLHSTFSLIWVSSAYFSSLSQVAPLIRGPVGSRIELELLRPGAAQTTAVTLTRQRLVQAGPAPAGRNGSAASPARGAPPRTGVGIGGGGAGASGSGTGGSWWGSSPAKSTSNDGEVRCVPDFHVLARASTLTLRMQDFRAVQLPAQHACYLGPNSAEWLPRAATGMGRRVAARRHHARRASKRQ